MPGVSMSSAPPGSSTSWRAVVVWRPSRPRRSIAPTLQRLAAEQPIDQSRLADAGRTEQRDRLRRTQIRLERAEPVLLQRADDDDVDERKARADRRACAGRVLARDRPCSAAPPGTAPASHTIVR